MENKSKNCNEEIIKTLQKFNIHSIEELSETYGKFYDFVIALFIIRNNLSNCESIRAANNRKLNKILNKMYGI